MRMSRSTVFGACVASMTTVKTIIASSGWVTKVITRAAIPLRSIIAARRPASRPRSSSGGANMARIRNTTACALAR